LGLSLVGALAAHTAVNAQFAAERGTPPPAQPAAPMPRTVPVQQPAAPPVQQSAASPAQSTPSAHPLYVRPEVGGWMICVKSYTGPEAQQLAEQMANEIRQTYKAGAYLFEWGDEERQKEQQRRERIKQEMAKEYAPFLAIQREQRAKAEREGIAFIPTPAKVRLGKIEYPEQWAVLVGGFKDMKSARAALDTVRQWQPPRNTKLLDRAVIAPTSNQQVQGEGAYINPFATAMVVPNPAIRRSEPGQPPPIDPALVELNQAEDLSLLKARKKWTLIVKRFNVPTQIQSKKGDVSFVDKLFSGDKPARMLEATARQARALAQALRDSKMKPHPFEAFVLHHRTESFVTVGQFDSPDDPAMAQMWQILSGMTFKIEYKDGRPPETKRMFDAIIPMQVPQVR
jgi:hypothetical protein